MTKDELRTWVTKHLLWVAFRQAPPVTKAYIGVAVEHPCGKMICTDGMATCGEGDPWSEEIGKAIASHRAIENAVEQLWQQQQALLAQEATLAVEPDDKLCETE